MTSTSAIQPSRCHDLFSEPTNINHLQPASSRWTVTGVIANLVGASFLVASAATNVRYAVTKSADPIDQGIAALIATAVAVGLALSIPALFKSKTIAGKLVSLAAVGLFGTYSVTAALGSLGGHRLDAAGAAQDASGSRARTVATYSRTEAELAAVGPARAASEVEPEISATMLKYRVSDCDQWQRDTRVRAACVEIVAPLKGELARAQRRGELQDRLDGLSREMAPGPGRVANADAAVLAAMVEVFGIKADVSRLNLALTILAVAVLELGAGLCFALGEAVVASGTNRQAGMVTLASAVNQATATLPVTTDRVALPKPTKDHGEPAASPAPGSLNSGAPQDQPDEPGDAAGDARAIQGDAGDAASADASGPLGPWLMKVPVGRPVQVSQRELGEVVGLSQASVSRALRALRDAGAIQVVSGAGGTCITRHAAGA